MTNLPEKSHQSEIILYQTDDGKTRLQVRLENETVWLTQKLMAELFQKDVRTVNEHIQNIYVEGELLPNSTIRKFRIVQNEGKRNVTREVDHYNLDVIISVGYRVKSHRGTQFRIWATQRLRRFPGRSSVIRIFRGPQPKALIFAPRRSSVLSLRIHSSSRKRYSGPVNFP